MSIHPLDVHVYIPYLTDEKTEVLRDGNDDIKIIIVVNMFLHSEHRDVCICYSNYHA